MSTAGPPQGARHRSAQRAGFSITRGRPTLARHLLFWTLGALFLVWLTFIAVGYKTGQHEADELTDGHLASASAMLLAYSGGRFADGASASAAMPAELAELKAHDYQQSMSVVVWDARGTVLTRTGRAPLPAFSSEEGFATLSLGQPPQPWRAFSRWDGSHDRKLMVLLSVRERDDLAEDIAEQVSEPGLWLMPVVALVLGLAIWRGLRPLHDVTREVHALDIHQARPLGVQPRHEELAETVDAINRLVERYHAALSRERALASEFAHELRTPMAALALHARALRESGAGDAEALARLEREVQRAGEVVAHLLALARASRAELDEAAQPVDLAEVARELVAQTAPAAHAGGRELGLAADGTLSVQGHAVLLQIALRNLIDNALHHTPPGSQIEVRVDAAGRWVEVSDAPPPVPPSRKAAPEGALGLGLGHRVVEKIAAIHGARFDRLAADGGRNAYRITFG